MTISYYLENFTEKFFDFLVKVLLFCFMCLILAGMLKIQENNRIMRQHEMLLENSDEWYMYSERIPLEECIERNMERKDIPEAEIPELKVFEVKTEIVNENELQTQIITENIEMQKVSKETILELKVVKNYQPTEEERQFAYKIAFAEAGVEGSVGQTLVINAAINNMRKNGFSSLIEEFKAEGRYQSVKNGEVYNSGKVVTEVPDSVKVAVDLAFEYDYSEAILKQQAENLGITDSKYWEGGATYFYNPEYCSERQNKLREKIKVKFQYGDHIFYRYWDKK